MLKSYYTNISEETLWIFAGLLLFLTLCSLGFYLAHKRLATALTKELVVRTQTWWKITLFVFLLATLPQWGVSVIMSYISFVALRELLSVLSLTSIDRYIILVCYLSIPIYYGVLYAQLHSLVYLGFPIAMLFVLPLLSINQRRRVAVRSLVILYICCILTVFLPSYLMLILQLKTWIPWVQCGHLFLFLIFMVAFNDVFQFTWGKLLGRTKIFPNISPNKTLEGLIFGILTTIIFGLVLRYLTPFEKAHILIVGGVISVAGIMGDLLLSAIKRRIGIKDFSQALPGHGGVLDRLDSLLLAAPVFYYMILILLIP